MTMAESHDVNFQGKINFFVWALSKGNMHFKGKTNETCSLRMNLKSCHRWAKFLIILHLYSMACLIPCVTSQLSNTMTPYSVLNPGSDGTLLVSGGRVFEVGFTSRVQAILPSPVYALAIWYANVTDNKVVWVASRSMALPSNKASLSLSAHGDLQVHDNSADSPQLVWSSNTINMNVVNATIEDTGNLVLRNTSNQVVWQSFDSPTDTLLPGQRFSASSSAKTITAWKSNGDWSDGNYSLQWDITQIPAQLKASWQNPYPWENVPGQGIPYWTLGADSGFPTNISSLTLDGQFQAAVQDRLLRLTLDSDGNFRMYSWSTNWTVEWTAVQNECAISGYCGPYSICLSGQCTCPDRFRFVDVADKRLGCQRMDPAPLCDSARSPDTFVNVSNINWSGNDLTTFYNVNATDCFQQCLSSCKCVAVIFSLPLEANGTIGKCWHKRDALLNGQALPTSSYLRVAGASRSSSKWKVWVVVGVVSGASALAMAALARYFFSRKAHSLDSLDKAFQARLRTSGGNSKAFSEVKIKQATNNYASVLGHGGFGDVFYGKLTDGTKVAAKVLSANSHQSKHEFYNEIELLSKVHHKYLVSLLGYCCTRQHQILVYEFMGGGNLRQRLQREDPFPDPLSWKQRTCIMLQVAEEICELKAITRLKLACIEIMPGNCEVGQVIKDDLHVLLGRPVVRKAHGWVLATAGLEYLHHKCSPPIIHRDIKSVNILLTNNLVAKVADFGLSKLKTIGLEDATHITTAVKGTPGYLDPEYYESGMLTEKSDVYAFGVVLLEILTGRHHMWQAGTYIVQGVRDAWRLEQLDDMADPNLREDFDTKELVKLVELGLWCARKSSLERPSMDKVVRRLHAILLPSSELAMTELCEEDQHHMMSIMELMPLNSDKFSSELCFGESLVSCSSSEVPRP